MPSAVQVQDGVVDAKLPEALQMELSRWAEARATWELLPADVRRGLAAFVGDGWLSRTRRRRSEIVVSRCAEGVDSVMAWRAANAQFARAAASANRSTGLTMNQ